MTLEELKKQTELIKSSRNELAKKFGERHGIAFEKWVDEEFEIARFKGPELEVSHYHVQDMAHDHYFKIPVGKIERFHKEGVDNTINQDTTFSKWLSTNTE